MNQMKLFWQKIIRSFSNSPKLWWSLVLLVSFSAIIIGSWKIVKNIKSPFQLADDSSVTSNITVKDELDKLVELRQKDSDQDGLSDYDELYIYNTSPYLEDTDSDGYLDKIEIETGNDPNCPAGENCLLEEEGGKLASPGVTLEEDKNNVVDFFQLDPGNLRALLISQGMDPEVLKTVDDQTLQQLYQEALKEFQSSSDNFSASENQNKGSSQQLAPNSEITPNEIRQELLKQGVDKQLLDQISDEELLRIYQDIINSQSAGG